MFTRRNAVLATAEFTDDLARLDAHIDWALMKLTYWKNTSDDGDRRARRMAECLVPGPLPLEAFIGIAARTEQQVAHAEALLTTLDVEIPVRPRPNWYFD